MSKKVVLLLDDSANNTELKELIAKNEEFEVIDHRDVKYNKATIIVNGPMTRLANMLMSNYRLADNIEEVIFVGGSATIGDVTPCAEKNVLADVLAAKAVFNSPVPITVFDLNTTRDFEKKALLPLAYLVKPELFNLEECGIFVETQGGITYGKTVCDILSDAQFDNHHCQLVLSFDHDGFEELVKTL